MRTAAVADFLGSLRARGSGDLNSVLTTFNDSGLARESVRRWTESGWIVIAPANPLLALPGPRFSREVTLQAFCGIEAEEREEAPRSDGDS